MWTNLIITALGSGSLAGAISWVFSKRSRDNSFIPKLQETIKVLSDNYAETLKDAVITKRQNAELLMGQAEAELQMDKLKKMYEESKTEWASIKCQNHELIKQNNELLAGQSTLQKEIDSLRKENYKLSVKVNELNKLLKNPDICKK